MGRHDGEIDNDRIDLMICPPTPHSHLNPSLLDSDPETPSPTTRWMEYVADIQRRYLWEAEVRVFLLSSRCAKGHHPSPNYIASRPALTWSMCALFNDWLLQVHTRFGLPETLLLCANLTVPIASGSPKRSFSAPISPPVSSTRLVSPAIENFLQISDSAQGRYPGVQPPDTDVVDVSMRDNAGGADASGGGTESVGSGGNVGCEGCAGVETGDKVKEEKAEVWTPTLAHYAGYTEREILASGAPEAILRCVPSPSFYRIPRYPRTSSAQSHGDTRGGEGEYEGLPPQASVFMRTWALVRWDEGTKPDLVKDLAGLKAEIRLKLKHDSAREGEAGEEC
ncbi:hypothetical protein B0H13DRAFT_2649302 [Mycena leptocephala]|nr:hypothetical protein B0H13DRAFT_2649302 [Mycena leptocephala]